MRVKRSISDIRLLSVMGALLLFWFVWFQWKLLLLAFAGLLLAICCTLWLVIGFFGALNPRAYRNGLILLVPARHRERARELSSEVVATRRSWLLGQMIPMITIGIASMISLWILGVHLAFTLSIPARCIDAHTLDPNAPSQGNSVSRP